MSITSYLIITSMLCLVDQQIEIAQWRGPNRDGIFPATNLLKEWPVDGPEMLWSFEGLGQGHGNVGIGKQSIFACGMIDSVGHLFSFDKQGNLLWKKPYGMEWYKDYTGSRSTPVVSEGKVYFESGQGVVFCYNELTGDLLWSVDLLKKFNAENIQWGMAESLLIDGNKIYCTPGGKEHNVVALDKYTGATIWTSTGNRQPAAYCSPILVNHNKTQLIVTMTAASIIGIDANTGEMFWSVEQRQGNKIHANTPLYHEGKILCSSSSDKSDLDGTVLLQLSEDGKKAEEVWRNTEIKNLMGGVILLEGHIYGSKYRTSEWYCVDWATGEVLYTERPFRNGVIVYADGLFYCYSEGGDMALVLASPEKFNVISEFKVALGTNQHWAHPVIDEGRLFIRHGNALMVYHISK